MNPVHLANPANPAQITEITEITDCTGMKRHPLCRCGADLLEDNHSGMCAECTLIAKQSAVADRAGHLDGESA